jgi:hypothetical protein
MRHVKVIWENFNNKICIHEEIKSSELRNCLLSFDSHSLTSRLLIKNMKVNIHRNIFQSLVLNKLVTCSLTVWEEYRLTVFRNRVPKNVFRPKRAGLKWVSKKRHNRDLPD